MLLFKRICKMSNGNNQPMNLSDIIITIKDQQCIFFIDAFVHHQELVGHRVICLYLYILELFLII